MQEPRYSFDTSSLIRGMVEAYPKDIPIFSRIWDKIEELIDHGRVHASIEVKEEIERKDDSTARWCQEHPSMFVESSAAIQEHVAEIIASSTVKCNTSEFEMR